MMKYQFTATIIHDQNGANCFATLNHFSEFGKPSIDVSSFNATGENTDEVLVDLNDIVQKLIEKGV